MEAVRKPRSTAVVVYQTMGRRRTIHLLRTYLEVWGVPDMVHPEVLNVVCRRGSLACTRRVW